jgi:hypothetical protein
MDISSKAVNHKAFIEMYFRKYKILRLLYNKQTGEIIQKSGAVIYSNIDSWSEIIFSIVYIDSLIIPSE